MEEKEDYKLDCFIGDLDTLEQEIKKSNKKDIFKDLKAKKEEENVSVSKLLDEIRGDQNA